MRGGDFMYYPFLLNLWIMNSISEAQIIAFTPYYITQAECTMILLSPQMTKEQLVALKATI